MLGQQPNHRSKGLRLDPNQPCRGRPDYRTNDRTEPDLRHLRRYTQNGRVRRLPHPVGKARWSHIQELLTLEAQLCLKTWKEQVQSTANWIVLEDLEEEFSPNPNGCFSAQRFLQQ